MATRVITTRLAIDGEAEFKRQMSSVNGELRNLKSEMQLTDAQFKGQANTLTYLTQKDKLLREEVAQQEEKVKALNQALQDSVQVNGETASQTDRYRQQLNQAKTQLTKMNQEIDENAKYMKEAERNTDHCAESIDEFGKSAKDASPSIEDLINKTLKTGNLSSLGSGLVEKFGGKIKLLGAAGVAGAAVKGLQAVTEAAFELVESTEEYRKIMGTLEVSSQAAGYTAEQTSETYNRLNSVLGDTQAAATTTANLQAIGLEQDKLRQLTDATVGAWATYGDSIPIDGLAEAVNETIKAGAVTGTFADVLNWGSQEGETFGITMKANTKANEEWNKKVEECASAEDYFNLALENCSSEAERADLVMQAMAKQGLKDSGEAWFENNKDIVANNEATAKMEAATARLAEKLVPLTTGLKTLGAEALTSVLDAGEDIYKFFQALPGELDSIVDEFGEIGKNVVNGFVNGIKSKWNSAISSARNFVNGVKDAFTNPQGFDTHSPSKWSYSVAEYVMDGLMLGMEDSKGEVMETAQDIVDEIKRRFDTIAEAYNTRQDVAGLEYDLWEMMYGENVSEADKYDKKLEMLTQKQMDQASVVESAEAAYAAVAKQYGENSAESLAYQKTLLQEQIEYQKLLQSIQEVLDAKDQLYEDSGESQRTFSLVSGNAQRANSAVSDETYRRSMLSAASDTVTGVTAGGTVRGQVASPQAANVTLITKDGKEIARGFVDDFRTVMKETPEVKDD